MEINLSQGVICPNNWDGLLLLNVSSHQPLKPFHIKLALHAALLPGDLLAPKEVSTLKHNFILHALTKPKLHPYY